MLSRRFWRGAAYLSSFTVGRGVLFASPLILANLLAQADYGTLETAHAMASLAANLTAMGTAAVVPLVLLGHAPGVRLQGILLHHLALVGLCLATSAAAYLLLPPGPVAPAALLTAAVLLQSLGSTHLKSLGRGEASVLLDAGLFGLMAAAAAIAYQVDRTHIVSWVWAAGLGYAAVLLAAYIHQLYGAAWCDAGRHWRSALVMGLPLMLGGIVSLLATTSGRLGMGLLAGPETAADYAVLSRAAALPIVAHQLVLIGRFRHLFTLPEASVERAATQIVLLVAASAVGFWLLNPWLGWLLGPAFVSAWQAHRLPGLWILAQAVLWSAVSLNDLVISRHQAMAKVLPSSASFMALAMVVGLAWLSSAGPTLLNFVQAHAVLMLLFYGVQSAAMYALGIRLQRTWTCAVGAYVLMLAGATCLT